MKIIFIFLCIILWLIFYSTDSKSSKNNEDCLSKKDCELRGCGKGSECVKIDEQDGDECYECRKSTDTGLQLGEIIVIVVFSVVIVAAIISCLCCCFCDFCCGYNYLHEPSVPYSPPSSAFVDSPSACERNIPFTSLLHGKRLTSGGSSDDKSNYLSSTSGKMGTPVKQSVPKQSPSVSTLPQKLPPASSNAPPVIGSPTATTTTPLQKTLAVKSLLKRKRKTSSSLISISPTASSRGLSSNPGTKSHSLVGVTKRDHSPDTPRSVIKSP